MKVEDTGKGAWIVLPGGRKATKLGKVGNKVRVILTTGERLTVMIGVEVDFVEGVARAQ